MTTKVITLVTAGFNPNLDFVQNALNLFPSYVSHDVEFPYGRDIVPVICSWSVTFDASFADGIPSNYLALMFYGGMDIIDLTVV